MHHKDYSQHLRDAKGCSHRWRILQLRDNADKSTTENFSKFRIVPVRCNSKACPTCSRRYFRKIRYRFKANAIKANWRFFTLTTIHNGEPNADELQKLEDSFRELRKHLKRKFPELQYFAVKELSPSGMWHIHGLWNIYIDVKDLSILWLKYSNAYRVDLRKVRNPKGAVNYLFKYIFKSSYNDTEKRLIYENDKRKFSYSKSLFHKLEIKNPYTSNLGTDYNVSELKEKLIEMVHSSNCSVNDFDCSEYPYFDELMQNVFSAVFENDFFY